MENFKKIWTDKDFPDMGWHDNRLYGFSLDYTNYNLIFDIDYIFKWVIKPEEKNYYEGFVVAPCSLIFNCCSDISINIDMHNTSDLIISEIVRLNPCLTPNKKFTQYTYKIILDNGQIEFTSIKFAQIIKEPPVKIINQDLEYGIERCKAHKYHPDIFL